MIESDISADLPTYPKVLRNLWMIPKFNGFSGKFLGSMVFWFNGFFRRGSAEKKLGCFLLYFHISLVFERVLSWFEVFSNTKMDDKKC